MTQEVNTADVVLPSFYDFWRACRDDKYTHYVCKGGRNSAKSTTISERLLLDTIDLPLNSLCIRKVERTLQESVYEQLKEAANILKVADDFTFLKNPLKIIYNGRGNYILFRGADDPMKLKSIKTSNFPIGRLWFEELAEFKTEDEIQTIVSSILRAELSDGMKYKIYYSYNPPKRKQSWINKKYESQFLPDNTYIHSSCYLDNKFLSEQALDDINHLKATNQAKYKWMYLGEPTGGGVVPFDNLEFRTITDAELTAFDNIRQGLDWGYASDPVAFVKWHYDKTRRTIYALNEIYGTKVSNRSLAAEMSKRGFDKVETIADSAEPKSIAEMRNYNVKMNGAKKGEGSVEYGEKWLDDLEKIVIDQERTPNIAKEFESIDYQVDKDGNQKAKLEDKDNHCFIGETLVRTAKGEKQIKEIEPGEYVMTRDGYKEVLQSELTRRETDVYRFRINNCEELICTKDHKIYTQNRGFIDISDLTLADILIKLKDANTEIKEYAVNLVQIEYVGRRDVYNLSITSLPEYFANNILVHNCIDATRYAFQDDMKRREIKAVASLY